VERELEAAITSKNVKVRWLSSRVHQTCQRALAPTRPPRGGARVRDPKFRSRPKVWNEIVELTADTSIRRNVKPSGFRVDESSHAVAVHNAGYSRISEIARDEVPPPPPRRGSHGDRLRAAHRKKTRLQPIDS